MRYAIPAAIVLIIGSIVWAAWSHDVSNPVRSPYAMRTLTIGTQSISAEVADTDPLRQLGLGGRASLPAGQGMLFIFDHPANWGIWMKDMQFAIDIIWVRQDGTVSTVARNVSPDTYPQVFYPKTPDALYVVELSAGAAKGIAEGVKMVVQ